MNALMIPIHPAKFNWLYTFLRSIPESEIKKLNFELVLLVSNEKERIQISRAINSLNQDFSHIIQYLDIHSYIDIYLNDSKLLERYIKNEDKCIVNLKKFLGLHWGSSLYDYIAMIDCDTIFNYTTSMLFGQLIDNYKTKKIFIGGENVSDIISNIQKNSASFFSEDNFKELEKLTKNFQSYSWFFDVPFYERNDLKDFYDFLLLENIDNYNFWIKVDWWSFEHIVYQFYLIMKKDFVFINYGDTCRNTLPENLTYSDLNKIYLKYQYYPVWARFRNVLSSPENYSGQGVSLFYHVDRQ